MLKRTLNTGSQRNAEIEAQLPNMNDVDNVTNMTSNISPTSMINKLVDWPPNYHKTERAFSQIFLHSNSINNLTLNEPVKMLN